MLLFKKIMYLFYVSQFMEKLVWHICGKSVNHNAVLGRTTALAGTGLPGCLKPPGREGRGRVGSHLSLQELLPNILRHTAPNSSDI